MSVLSGIFPPGFPFWSDLSGRNSRGRETGGHGLSQPRLNATLTDIEQAGTLFEIVR